MSRAESAAGIDERDELTDALRRHDEMPAEDDTLRNVIAKSKQFHAVKNTIKLDVTIDGAVSDTSSDDPGESSDPDAAGSSASSGPRPALGAILIVGLTVLLFGLWMSGLVFRGGTDVGVRAVGVTDDDERRREQETAFGGRSPAAKSGNRFAPGSFADILTSDQYEWAAPEKLGSAVNTNAHDFSPFVSSDGLTLLFVSNRKTEPDAKDNYDVWECTRSDANAKWSPAEHLEMPINTFAWETAPHLSPGQKELFWISKR